MDPWGEKIPWKRPSETHSSILAWRMPWTAEPGGLQSVGLQSRPRLSTAPCSHQNPRWGGAGLSARLVSWPPSHWRDSGHQGQRTDSGPRLLGSSPGSVSAAWPGANSSPVFFDNIAQVLSSDFNGLKTRQRFQIKLLEIQENIDLNECQSPVNWELVNIKYLVFLVLLLHYRHV